MTAEDGTKVINEKETCVDNELLGDFDFDTW